MQTRSLIYNTYKFNTSFPNVFEVSSTLSPLNYHVLPTVTENIYETDCLGNVWNVKWIDLWHYINELVWIFRIVESVLCYKAKTCSCYLFLAKTSQDIGNNSQSPNCHHFLLFWRSLYRTGWTTGTNLRTRQTSTLSIHWLEKESALTLRLWNPILVSNVWKFLVVIIILDLW